MPLSRGLLPRRVVLASSSPRRKDLLEAAGFEVVIRPSGITELSGGMPPRDLVEANAVMKALDVAQTVSGDLVLAADTVVVLDGEVLGKPTDFDHARVMLSRLSGRIHEVLTGVCMLRGGTQARCSFVESTRVSFRQLDAEAMESYLREINPLDKAGAYAAQDDRGRLIEQIEGPLDNVIGLPVTRVTEAMLRHFTESPAG